MLIAESVQESNDAAGTEVDSINLALNVTLSSIVHKISVTDWQNLPGNIPAFMSPLNVYGSFEENTKLCGCSLENLVSCPLLVLVVSFLFATSDYSSGFKAQKKYPACSSIYCSWSC